MEDRFPNLVTSALNIWQYARWLTPRAIEESNVLGVTDALNALIREYRPEKIQIRSNPSYRLEQYQRRAKTHQACGGTDFDGTDWYKYVSLPSPRHIRVLRLEAGKEEDIINTSISTHLVDEVPDFIALSYTWGNAQITHNISCEEATLTVTRNLWEALLRIRLLDAPHLLWIDALCINQADEQERNTQVKLMGEIYSRAGQVLVWIGGADEQSRQAIELMKKIRPIADKYNGYRVIPGAGSFTRNIEFTHEDLKDLPPTSSLYWKALESIYWRPWWTRCWVIQEICLSQNAVFLCGDLEVHARDVLLGAYFLRASGVANMTDINLGSAVSIGFWHDSCMNGNRMSLRALLSATRLFYSTDKRDKVYALLGICKEEDSVAITPDYSRSVADIYTALTTSQISQGNLDILTAVCDIQWRLAPDIPSWVPDWSTVPRATDFLLPGSELNVSATGTSQAKISFSSDGRKMRAHGTHFDIVHQVGLPYLFRSLKEYETLEWLTDFWKDYDASQKFGIDMMKSLRLRKWGKLALSLKKYPTGELIRTAYMRTLTANAFMESEEITLDMAYRAFLETYFVKKRKAKHTDIEMTASHWFDDLMDRACTGRTLFVTKKGYLGLGPQSIRKGESVVLLRGGKTPYALRGAKDNKWIFLGECYVHGIMHGEAFKEEDAHQEFCLT